MHTFRPWPEPTDAQRKIGMHTDSIDLTHPANTSTSKEYYKHYLQNCYHADGDKDLMFYAIQQISIDGLICEFGTWKAHSINYIASQLPEKTIYGFDVFNSDNASFKNNVNWQDKDFRQNKLPDVLSNVKLIVGWFDKTTKPFFTEHTEPLALLHIDCDEYAGAVDAFKHANIVSGTIIVFDEYLNYTGWEHHEYKAWEEYVFKHQIKYEYIAVNTRHQQVAIKVL